MVEKIEELEIADLTHAPCGLSDLTTIGATRFQISNNLAVFAVICAYTLRWPVFYLCPRFCDDYTIAATRKIIVQTMGFSRGKNEVSCTAPIRVKHRKSTLHLRPCIATKCDLRLS